MKKAFIVMVFGYWGRGPTLQEAAALCLKQGANKRDRAIARLIMGDDKPTVSGCGDIWFDEKAENIALGNNFKLGALLK